MLREHCVSDLSKVEQFGRELDAIRNREVHTELHNVALLAVCLLIPVLFKLVLEDLAAIFQQDVALVTIFKNFIDTFSNRESVTGFEVAYLGCGIESLSSDWEAISRGSLERRVGT
jgi:hypothetical protein